MKGSKAARLVKGFRHCCGCAVIAVVNVVVRNVGEVQPFKSSTFHHFILQGRSGRSVSGDALLREKVQGDTSRCSLGSVDMKTKVAF